MDQLLTGLASQGLLGVVAAILVYAVIKLFNMLMEAHNLRVEEGKKTLEALNNSTLAMKEQTEAVKALTEASYANYEIIKEIKQGH